MKAAVSIVRNRPRVIVCVFVLIVLTGCASTEHWAEWRRHPSHFASGAHLAFSLRHQREGQVPIRRRDVDLARAESWWGDPIVVRPDQLFGQATGGRR